MRTSRLRLVARTLRYWPAVMIVGIAIGAFAAGLQSPALFICCIVVVCVAEFAFIVDRARKSRKQERLEVATRLAKLQAENWPLTPPPTSAPSGAERISVDPSIEQGSAPR